MRPPSSSPCEFTKPDVYRQIHPLENATLIENKRKEFELEVDKLSPKVKSNLSQAQEKCPNLLSDDFKLMFLRCEVFHANVSLPRERPKKSIGDR